jgi:galactonate dehydratase
VKITGLTTYQVPPRWLFLKVETDEGVTGWGEPVLEGRADSVAAGGGGGGGRGIAGGETAS